MPPVPDGITDSLAMRLEAVDRLRLQFYSPLAISAELGLKPDAVNYCLNILRQGDKARAARLDETQDEMRAVLEQFHLNEVNDCLIKAKTTESETTWSAAKRLASDNAERAAKLRGLQAAKLDLSGSLSIAKILGQVGDFISDEDPPPPIV